MDQLVPSPPIGQARRKRLASALPGGRQRSHVCRGVMNGHPICFSYWAQDIRLAASRTFWAAATAANQDGDDRDHHQQLDQRNAVITGSFPCLRIRFMMTPRRERILESGEPIGREYIHLNLNFASE